MIAGATVAKHTQGAYRCPHERIGALHENANQLEAADEVTLMRAVAAGDERALKCLYDRVGRKVFALAKRMLGNPSEAEQLLTDVFYELWSARTRYDETRAAPMTYIMRLTRSRAIDRLRQRASRPAAVSLDTAAGIDVAADLAPENALIENEQQMLVRRALGTLPAEQREALAYAYFEGLTHQAIAEKMNKPLGSVKSSLRVALVRLRDVLTGMGQRSEWGGATGGSGK